MQTDVEQSTDSNEFQIEIFNTSEESVVVLIKQNKTLRFFAFIFSGISVFAVLPVPYLTFRSVATLAANNPSLTFQEALHLQDGWFWVLGPIASVLATAAIAPFNMVTSYKQAMEIIQKSKLRSGALISSTASVNKILRILFRCGLLIAGVVNGFNMGLALQDLMGRDDFIKTIIYYTGISIAFLFAGIGDSKALSDYVAIELPRDIRRLARRLSATTSFFIREQGEEECGDIHDERQSLIISREDVLKILQIRMDELHDVVQLYLKEDELTMFSSLLDTKKLCEEERFINFVKFSSQHHPKYRLFFSEVFGSICSGTLAFFGQRNTEVFAKKGVESFLIWLGLSGESSAVVSISTICGWSAYVISFLLTVLLIRDLFFREVFRLKDRITMNAFLLRIILPLFPAFSYGLLNVMMTYLNEELSATEKLFTAFSAVIGATVISRYGIDNGLREIRGAKDARKALANLGEQYIQEIQELPEEVLRSEFSRLMVS